jgi:hypothetical protein
MFLSLKSEFDQQRENEEPAAWDTYIGESAGTGYLKSAGTEEEPNTLSVDDLPPIDLEACFIGQVSELGKRGIVTVKYSTQRSGLTTATIYAYTVESDHLKRAQLAQYDPDKGPNLVFTKYLSDSKRTQVSIQEITP